MYIKGMEMPKSCVECEFCYWSNLQQENICDKYDYTPVGDRFQYEKADFCPLTEVEEPHGRLIDADELIAVAERIELEGTTFCIDSVEDLETWFYDDSPTVIERSET